MRYFSIEQVITSYNINKNDSFSIIRDCVFKT